RWVSGAEVFAEKVGNGLPPIFHRLDITLSEMQLVAWSRWRWAANARLLRLLHGVFGRGPILVPLYFVLILVQAGIAFGGNLAARRGALRSGVSGQIVSSVFLR